MPVTGAHGSDGPHGIGRGHDGDGDHDECYDVVVVGSGAGALAGAHTAASAGLRTLVLEKADVVGGTSAYSGAACWLPGSDVQRRAGADDSTASARTYLSALLGPESADHREAFLAAAPEVVESLERAPSMAFTWQAFPDYFAAPGRPERGRSIVPTDLPAEELGELLPLVRPPVERERRGKGHRHGPLSGGRALIGRLLLAVTGTGSGTVRTGTRVTGLTTDRAGSRVTGVRATTPDGDTTRIGSRAGVLLAAGGFEGDPDLRRRHGVPGDPVWSMAPPSVNTGDPLRAAVGVGAATARMNEAWLCPGLAQPDGSAAFTLGLRGGLFVDRSGHRFANESLPYDRMGRELAAAPDRVPAHFVFDSRHDGHPPAIAIPDTPAEDHVAAGTRMCADTLTELATALDVPADALQATVERFNHFARTGTDADFHRGEDPYDRFFADPGQGGPNPCLVPLDRPPFHAARIVLADLGTKGGLRTDVDARVLDTAGTAIPGLYAAGNTSASFTGSCYPGPGLPIGSAMTFAYRAVRAMTQ